MKENPRRLIEPGLITPDAQKKILFGIHDVDSAVDFFDKTFDYDFAPNYLDLLRDTAENFPNRAVNPSYWKLLGLVGIEAARYGFPESSGHLSIGGSFVHPRYANFPDAFHPINLLATTCYLGSINKQGEAEKSTAAKYWEELEGPDDSRDIFIWGSYRIPRKGVVPILPPENFFDLQSNSRLQRYYDRVDQGLLSYVPDPTYHDAIVRTGLTKQDILGIKEESDAQTIVERLTPILAPLNIDVASILKEEKLVA